MRRYILFLLLALSLVLYGCGDSSTEEKDVRSVETSTETTETEESDATEEESEDAEVESEVEEVGEVIVDDDNLKATLVNIEKIEDSLFDEEYYEVNIEVVNKREDTIEVQAHEVSADDVMIDDMVFFSETVSGGKTANATLTIQNFDGDLPSMDSNLEFTLMVFDEGFDVVTEEDVRIEF